MDHSIKQLGIALALVLGACGDDGNHVPLPDAPEPDAAVSTDNLQLFAGDLGGEGNADGSGDAARFSAPLGIAVDAAGTVYVADTGNRTIRRVTSDGAVTTLAGTPGVIGSADGNGPAASFGFPRSVALDAAGNLYVADADNHTIRKVTSAGMVTTFAGSAGMTGTTDGLGAAARFNRPSGVATDSAGNVYVADTLNQTIRKITAAGVVTTLAGSGALGSADGTGAAATFHNPDDVATDAAGNIYVGDSSNARIRKITPAGVVTTLAGQTAGSADGTGAAAQFGNALVVATDAAANVYVSDSGNQTIRKITPAGVVTTIAGTAGAEGNTDGTGAAARFSGPFGLAVDGGGTVYIADTGNSIIRKLTAAGEVTTFVGSKSVIGTIDGTGAAARFNFPFGVAVDAAGTVYVADTGNSTIRTITADGAVTTLAGMAGVLGSTDGTGLAASFAGPLGITVDAAGTVLTTDGRNHTIRVISAAGAVSTLAGMPRVSGSTDGTGAAARFNVPEGVAIDSAGNAYIADTFNNTIRRVTPAGVVTTFAGMAAPGGATDGIGAAARFLRPTRIAIDTAGTLYVADTGNHTIRAITPAGMVTTLAGTAGSSGSADGTGAAARFNSPTGVATDSTGNLYVADTSNHTIRKVTPAGVVTTVVGVANEATFTPGPLPGRLSFPNSVAVSGTSLYITCASGVAVVRKLP